MKVKMTVEQDGKVLEDYIVPAGSWIQTDTLGAQHAPAVLQPTVVWQSNRGRCIVEPLDAPKIRPELLKMVNSRDKAWGKNGYEYMGKNREQQGGTAIDRLSELAAWHLCYGKQGPVPFLPGEAEELSKL